MFTQIDKTVTASSHICHDRNCKDRAEVLAYD